jgi:restriction endonuclease S subunit
MVCRFCLRGGVPIGADLGPHQCGGSNRLIKGIGQNPAGSRFDADSQYVIDFHGNDPRLSYYLLKQFDFRRFNSGSAQPSLNRNFIHPAPINVPPLDEQQAIAGLLGALDDKIELNRCMAQTLEAMARTLFQELVH